MGKGFRPRRSERGLAWPLHLRRGVNGLARIFGEGVDSWSERELVHVLLGGGAGGDALAGRLLGGGLSALLRLRDVDLARDWNLSGVRAARLLAGLELGRRALFTPPEPRPRLTHAGQLVARLWPRLAHLPHEEFWALLLSARLEEVRAVRISAGGLSQCSVLPREAFGPALVHGAPGIAFAHNHPSGDPTPSGEDLRLQLLLEEVGHALHVQVVDQLVIGAGGAHSARVGLIPPPSAPGSNADRL
ncbi:MAG: DNA repair protein RadC [Myxococcales bacterium]